MAFYIGAPVWAHKGWVGNFFPKGSKSADYLCEYAKRLTTVEGNTTFYAVPAPDTVQRWRDDTSDTFRFCLKLPRAISHAGPLLPHLDEARNFVDLMRGLGTRLGPMFLQLPPRYSPTAIDDLRSFLVAWPREVALAVEVRHADWFKSPNHQRLHALLREFALARVLFDVRPIRDVPEDKVEDSRLQARVERALERKPDVPLVPELTAPFTLVRYIGHPQVDLNLPLLDEWADRLAAWLREGIDVYAFCHAPDVTVSPQICRALYERVAARVQVDPLPWDTPESGVKVEQSRLL
ncbi:MAG TPA: DUF72 domain-containing protein [Anaerolineae bacterium]|nr:DUF72 domain-containing protein [Anaerolineae bacterium]